MAIYGKPAIDCRYVSALSFDKPYFVFAIGMLSAVKGVYPFSSPTPNTPIELIITNPSGTASSERNVSTSSRREP